MPAGLRIGEQFPHLGAEWEGLRVERQGERSARRGHSCQVSIEIVGVQLEIVERHAEAFDARGVEVVAEQLETLGVGGGGVDDVAQDADFLWERDVDHAEHVAVVDGRHEGRDRFLGRGRSPVVAGGEERVGGEATSAEQRSDGSDRPELAAVALAPMHGDDGDLVGHLHRGRRVVGELAEPLAQQHLGLDEFLVGQRSHLITSRSSARPRRTSERTVDGRQFRLEAISSSGRSQR